jgi:hypothetical protein
MLRTVVVLVALGCACSNHTRGHDAGVPVDGLSCVPSGGCANGPACGNTCCGAGEACISGTCMCSMQPACTNGNMCASPVVMIDRCGAICCGATTACPGVVETLP